MAEKMDGKAIKEDSIQCQSDIRTHIKVPVQIFFCDPVVLVSICYCTRANRLINESNKTEWVFKNRMGSIDRLDLTRSFRRVKLFLMDTYACMHELEILMPVEIITSPIFFCDPVVLELLCYRTRANRLRNESATTGGLRKIERVHVC